MKLKPQSQIVEGLGPIFVSETRVNVEGSLDLQKRLAKRRTTLEHSLGKTGRRCSLGQLTVKCWVRS